MIRRGSFQRGGDLARSEGERQNDIAGGSHGVGESRVGIRLRAAEEDVKKDQLGMAAGQVLDRLRPNAARPGPTLVECRGQFAEADVVDIDDDDVAVGLGWIERRHRAQIGRAIFQPVELAAALEDAEHYDQRGCENRQSAL